MLRRSTSFVALSTVLFAVGCGSSSSGAVTPRRAPGRAGALPGRAGRAGALWGREAPRRAVPGELRGNPRAGRTAPRGCLKVGHRAPAHGRGAAHAHQRRALPVVQPARNEGSCLTPFPNAIYTTEDATTHTGYRVNLVSETLPVEVLHNTPLSVDRYNMADGFSPATPILTYFPERIDATSLPPITDPSQSLVPTSATVIVDMTSNQLVAHFSEVDVTAKSSGRQALMLRPTTRLLPSHRYAVAVTPSIKTKTGGTAHAAAAIRRNCRGESALRRDVDEAGRPHAGHPRVPLGGGRRDIDVARRVGFSHGER